MQQNSGKATENKSVNYSQLKLIFGGEVADMNERIWSGMKVEKQLCWVQMDMFKEKTSATMETKQKNQIREDLKLCGYRGYLNPCSKETLL